MNVHFWGVRGSIPAPLTPIQIQNRIAAVVQRITAKDIRDVDSRECFLASLPKWLFGTVGGNTSCVEVQTAAGDTIILDAGSGIRELSEHISGQKGLPRGKTYHVFFSHFHWDHLQGLPFFLPGYNPANRIVFYSTNPDLRTLLNRQMESPYFPVPFDGPGGFQAKLEFVHLSDNESGIRIGDTHIRWFDMDHPGGCVAYRIEDAGKVFIYATDTELNRENFVKNEKNSCFFSGADAVVMDSQYTMDEALQKTGWGHSAFSMTVDFALNWEFRKLILFHHEPTYSDKKLYAVKQSASWYSDYSENGHVDIEIASEGMELEL